MSRYGQRTLSGSNRQISALGKVPKAATLAVDYAIIGGGGGGGKGTAFVNLGAGAAGGVLNTGTSALQILTNYAVVIGAGGVSDAGAGSSSSFNSITGTAGLAFSGGGRTGGSNAAFSGSTVNTSINAGAGAGSGGNASGANGGAGSFTSISGSSTGFGGGGAGADGGSGTASSGGGVRDTNGTVNTGGGAGGTDANGSTTGGSGFVKLAYPNEYTIVIGAGLTADTPTAKDGNTTFVTITAGSGNVNFI